MFEFMNLSQASPLSSGATSPPPTHGSFSEPPADILKRRYAAGEIDRDQYVQRLGDL